MRQLQLLSRYRERNIGNVGCRLLWSFQRRLLDTVKFVSLQFPDRVFYKWQNNAVDATPRARVDPTRFWAWDFLPLHNVSLFYTREGDERERPKVDDSLLEIRVLADTGYEMPDNRIEPDPTTFPTVEQSETTLSLMAFKCVEAVEGSENWYHHLWGNASWPSDLGGPDDNGVFYMEEGSLIACQIDTPLSRLIDKDAVKSFCDDTKAAFSSRLGIHLG